MSEKKQPPILEELIESLEAMERYAFALVEGIATGSDIDELRMIIIENRGVVTRAKAAIEKAKGEA